FDRLENGVYTLQYHPRHARDVLVNDGRGTFPWLLYAIAEAERLNFWIANKRMLYQRMNDYQDIRFRVAAEDQVVLVNPTSRRIEGLMVESSRTVRSVSDGHCYFTHIVGGRFFTIPPLESGAGIHLILSRENSKYPIIRQANHKALQILDACYDPGTQETHLEVLVIGEQSLLLENMDPHMQVRIAPVGEQSQSWTARADERGALILSIKGSLNNFTRQTIVLSPA
ncbi:MAG: hypothetical protein HY326_13655, partial [Chloroflexi bacterium]|nr:hypothetical protein [Chloroflexota bacterium]